MSNIVDIRRLKVKYVTYNRHKHRRATLAPRPIHTDNHLRLFQQTAND